MGNGKMVKVWASKQWESGLDKYGVAQVRPKRDQKRFWDARDWPPVRLVLMTEEEYHLLIGESPSTIIKS